MEAFSYIDEPRSGLMNMAIDDAMLDFSNARRAVVLRLYQWSEPTLSLGYFQRLSQRELHPPSSDLDVVRRATGGGAIVHHHDLTYSLAVPQSSSTVGAAPAIYHVVHEAIVQWLTELEIPASLWRATYNLPTIGVQHAIANKSKFLCFHRRSEGDVIVGDQKVMGSAQRRTQGAILQHGSLLISLSSYAPSLLGLQDLIPVAAEKMANLDILAGELCLRIQRGIDALLGISFQCNRSLVGELEAPAIVKVAKFESLEWRSRA